jgi:glyoxylase-like metal-dependent hydrolase (beta-lactamase superfamily II)
VGADGRRRGTGGVAPRSRRLEFFTPDPERNRQSIRRLGELDPALVLFGHGPAHTGTDAFRRFCAGV